MLDKKGQALVEFLLILPILIMLIFTVIDFGRIFVNKSELENALSIINNIERENINENTISDLVNKNKSKKINVELNIEDKYITVILSRKIDIITPGLNLIIPSPYEVKTSRVIINE